MPDDSVDLPEGAELIERGAGHSPFSLDPAGGAPPAYYEGSPASDEDEGPGFDPMRYVYAILRRKLLLAGALVLGLAGAFVAWNMAEPVYMAEGNLWVEVERRAGSAAEVSPIRQAGLLEEGAWVGLLRSYSVLDPVVIREHLYLSVPKGLDDAFSSFELAERYRPGRYEFEVLPGRRSYTLTGAGITINGALGGPVGDSLGFVWTPDPAKFPVGEKVVFDVSSPRDAAKALAQNLSTRMDRQGNFIALSIQGTDPDQIASVLNAVMDRHVELAADLKRSKLDETEKILAEQLGYAEVELANAERDLEEFRVNTITLPSDASMPIAPGLEVTRDPVFGSFFEMKTRLEEIRRDEALIRRATNDLESGTVRIEALTAVPSAAASLELGRSLEELVNARAQLSVLRDRYSDDYPPIQDLLTRIRTIEEQTVPNILEALQRELGLRERQLAAQVDSASRELTAIPPRTIEEARLRRRVAIQESLYNDLRQRVETARLAAASSIPDVRVLDYAAVPSRPTDDQRPFNAAVVLFGSLGAALLVALLLDRLDPKLRYPNEIGRELGLDILGSIPRINPAITANSVQVLEAFRELRVTVGFACGTAGPLTLTISSAGQGEGKSFVITNLAVTFAEAGRRTLLIDGDTRRGDAHRLLGVQRAPGLTDYLRERSGRDIIQSTQYANLDFIGSGTRGSSSPELLATPRIAWFMGSLKKAYDVILIDSPPLAAGGDAVLLAGLAGNLAVVIRTGTTERPLITSKLDMISRLPIRIVGAILNDVEAGKGASRYYATYLSDYDAREEGDREDLVEGSATALLTKESSSV